MKALGFLVLLALFGFAGESDYRAAQATAAAVSTASKAHARAPRHRDPEPAWRLSGDYLGEAKSPATLADCDPKDSIAVSYNSGIVAPWSRYCYGARR